MLCPLQIKLLPRRIGPHIGEVVGGVTDGGTVMAGKPLGFELIGDNGNPLGVAAGVLLGGRDGGASVLIILLLVILLLSTYLP